MGVGVWFQGKPKEIQAHPYPNMGLSFLEGLQTVGFRGKLKRNQHSGVSRKKDTPHPFIKAVLKQATTPVFRSGSES